MMSASKTTFSHFNLKILRLKVTKNIKNLHKKFCEFLPVNFLPILFGQKIEAQTVIRSNVLKTPSCKKM